MKLSKSSGCWAALYAGALACLLLCGCRTGSPHDQFAEIPGAKQPVPPPAVTKKAASPVAATNSAVDPELLKVGDVLVVTYSDLPAPQPPVEVTIRQDGTITLMFDHTFQAAEKTRHQLEQEIRSYYVPDYYKNMTVSVAPKELTRFYYVGGEVKVPGRQAYTGLIRVVEAIQTAGDCTDFAQRRKVRLTRADGKTVLYIDCIKARKDPKLDLPIYPGDRIDVPRRLY